MLIDSFLSYMAETAAIWEMLAFVKLRGVAGEPSLRFTVERETKETIHRRAVQVNEAVLQSETRRVRLALETERSRKRRSGDVDIKYGAGGMLDVYFAVGYLQLRHNIPDDAEDRSTLTTLDRLLSAGVLAPTPTPRLLKDIASFRCSTTAFGSRSAARPGSRRRIAPPSRISRPA